MAKFGDIFEEKLRSREPDEIIYAIIGFIDTDMYMESFQFKDVAQYAHQVLSQSGRSLYQADDGNWQLPSDPSLWTEDLWRELQIELTDNFSREKLDAMEELMLFLRKSGHPKFQVQENNFTRMRQRDMQTGKGNGSKNSPSGQIHAGMFIGGGLVLGGVLGSLVGAKILGVVLGGAAGFGAFQLYKKGI
jgi:hypothetical protein